MTHITSIPSKRRLPVSARVAGGLAVSALLALAAFTAPASADDWRNHREYYNSNSGYYGSPYGYGYGYYGSPYYSAPVYGPSVGITLPFVGIGIR
jgi:hypothetical protein